MGAEDFGQLRAPGTPILLMSVGSVSQERLDKYGKDAGAPSLHSPRYYPEVEATIKTGVTTFVSAATDLLPPK
jgi:hippurate hydrolase